MEDGAVASATSPLAAAPAKKLPPHDEMVKALLKATSTRLTELVDRYEGWDKDKDGLVDKIEFHKAMRALKLPGWDAEPPHVYERVCDEVFDLIDHDGNGIMSYREYVRYTLREAIRLERERVVAIFRKWDANGSSTICKEEWRRAIRMIGFVGSGDEVDALFDEIDVDHTGEVDYEELNRVLRQGAGMHLGGSSSPGKEQHAKGASGGRATRRCFSRCARGRVILCGARLGRTCCL